MSHLLGRLKAYTLKTACLCAALTLALSGTPAIAFAANAETQSTSNAEEMTQEKIDEANKEKKEPIRPKHHITKRITVLKLLPIGQQATISTSKQF